MGGCPGWPSPPRGPRHPHVLVSQVTGSVTPRATRTPFVPTGTQTPDARGLGPAVRARGPVPPAAHGVRGRPGWPSHPEEGQGDPLTESGERDQRHTRRMLCYPDNVAHH